MAQFVLVANEVTDVDFEKAMEVKIRSGDKVKFVPQGLVAGHPSNANQLVGSQPMNSAGNILNNVRFEWNHAGHEFGAEIVLSLAGHHKHHHHDHEVVEPAA